MDTGLDWLISGCNSARLLATLWGASTLLWLYSNVEIYVAGPPGLDTPFCPLYRYGIAFCYIEPNPLPGFLLSLALLMPSILGLPLVWLRPRSGLLLTALGWVCLWGSPFLHSHSKEDLPSFGWRWLTVFLLILLYLLFGALKAVTLRSRVDPSPNIQQAAGS